MADFKQVAGQLEGLWRASVDEAEAQGRKAGEAAGVERVLQVASAVLTEAAGTEGARGNAGIAQEIRRRAASLPALTPEEWERVRAALEPRQADVVPGADDRPGFRVGDQAAPVLKEAPSSADERALEREARREAAAKEAAEAKEHRRRA